MSGCVLGFLEEMRDHLDQGMYGIEDETKLFESPPAKLLNSGMIYRSQIK